MGAWGPAIFSDDTACDIRDDYKQEVANDVEGPEATRIVLAKFANQLNDPDDGPVIWLALAATQWKLGRLEDEVKAKALDIIDTGAGLDLWEEQGSELLDKRKAALQKLRDQLVSPQPPLKKVKKPFCPPIYLDIKAGDAISYQMQSGEYVIFRCIKYKIDRLYGAFPRFDLVDWIGLTIPSPSKISKMPSAREQEQTRITTDVFSIHAFRKRDFPADRVCVVARNLRIRRNYANLNYYWSMGWETIEEDIQKHFKLTPNRLGILDRLFKR